MNVRYHVELTQYERNELLALVSGGKHPARKLKRAQILLAADAGVGDEDIATSVGVGGSTVYRTKRRFVEGNLDLALSEEPRPGAERKLTGKEEALLVATACSSPPAGRARWTLELLADALVKLTAHESLSRETVRRRLAENDLKPWRKDMWCIPQVDADYVARRFPTIADMCRQVGLDLARDPIPVSPAAHYVMGGVHTDQWGRTSLPGLLAAGEVACTGVHGANRLASNSLLEGLVFGARAAVAMLQPPAAAALGVDRRLPNRAPSREPRVVAQRSLTTTEVRDLMWKSVGLFRTREGMEDAVAKLEASYAAHRDALANARADDGDAWKQFNLVTVARLIARAALRREESRGAHYRDDFPKRDDIHWKDHVTEDGDNTTL